MSSGDQEALDLADRLTAAEFGPSVGTANAAASTIRRLVAEREADRAVMREALEALEGATKIIVRVDKGITTLARQEADPLSGLNDVRAAISSLKARTQ